MAIQDPGEYIRVHVTWQIATKKLYGRPINSGIV